MKVIYMRTREFEDFEEMLALFIWDTKEKTVTDYDDVTPYEIPSCQVDINVNLKHGFIVRIGEL